MNHKICNYCDYLDDSFKEDDDFFSKEIEEIINSTDDKTNITQNLKKLISTLIYEYNTYPNMEVIKNIENIYEKLSEQYNLYIKNNDMNVNIEIFSENDYFEKNKEEDKKYFRKIEITNYSFNINILENEIFIKLKTLNLKGNNLSDIITLTKVKFENLKTLNLSSNQIGDNMIKSFYNFNFPKLKSLDVGINNLQNYEFFKSIEHFKELKELNIYSNLFKKETLNNLSVKEINLQSLEDVDFSNGVFSEETINFMFSIFKFKNLKKIGLTSNNLRTLNFIQSIYNCPLNILY